MKNLLMISSHFLPSEEVGAIRPSKFAKYLSEYGWKPIFLTPRRNHEVDRPEADIPVFYSSFPNPDRIFSLARHLFPKSRPQTTTNSKDIPKFDIYGRKDILVDWLFVPDEEVTAILFAVKKGLRIRKNYHVDGIFATGRHFSCHLIGLFLARMLKCPWVADFRDPWLTNPFSNYPTHLHRKVNEILESQVVRSADRVITVSLPIYQDFLNRYPDESSEKFGIIYNGYDSNDFTNLEIQANTDGIIHIVHSGSLYPGREPLSFLYGIQQLDPNILKRLQITFLGRNSLGLGPVVEQLGLSNIIRLQEYVPHRKCLEYLSQATILMAIPGLGQGSLTTKLFEYLYMGKYIFALSPTYNTALPELLEKANVGIVADPDSSDDIAMNLTRLIDMIDEGKTLEPNWDYIEQFDRKNLTGQLAQLLDEIVS